MANPKTKESEPKQSYHKKKTILVIAGISLLAIVVFCAILFAVYNFYYSDKILPHVKIGEYSISGKTKSELDDFLKNHTESGAEDFVVYTYNDKKWDKSPTDLEIKYDLAKTENEAMLIGHRSNFLETVKDQVLCLFAPYNINMSVDKETDAVRNFIAGVASEIDKPEKNASLKFENGKVDLVAEESGTRLDQNNLYKTTIDNILALQKTNVVLKLSVKKPDISTANISDTKQKSEGYVSEQFNLKYQNRSFFAAPETVWSWLKFEEIKNSLAINFDQDKMKEWITAKIASKIDDQMKEARLKFEGDKVVVFQQAQDGTVVDQDKLVADIISNLENGQHGADITTKVAKAKEANLPDLNSLYVKDLIGTGKTNFGNSPSNRIHNIQTGANTLSGILIKPGEEFSVVSSLGVIDASGGYLPELVIKETGTKPEYGGGLCQVSTTLFRAVMNAGLEVTDRTNHSYRVSYYEPPVGMDATVYDPRPDFKFINNYDNYILIQAQVDTGSSSITFNVYGKSDGRKSTISNPVVSDITDPEPPLYTETDTLCKGEVKRVESAHQGAKANFNYSVNDASGKQIINKTFYSSYVPWQAKYLTGTKEGPDCAPPPES